MKPSIIVNSSLRDLIWMERDKILSQDSTKKILKVNCLRSTKCLNELKIKYFRVIVRICEEAEDGPALLV